MVGFREKMESESAKAIYRPRGEVAEFPFGVNPKNETAS
jgi:hypothetical protein